MKKDYREKPLRSFPWSGSGAKTPGQLLVESTVVEWYSAKHRPPSGEEIAFINSIEVRTCPFCGGSRLARDGRNPKGVRRLRCACCGRRFTPLTGTIFDSKKIPMSEWVEYLIHLFSYHSNKSSAFANRNAEKTGSYWLLKVFAVLEGIQDGVVLEGEVQIDETFVSVSSGDAKRHRDGTLLAGISRNQIGIAAAICRSGSILINTGTSKPSASSTLAAYGGHIAPGSTIVHDGEKSHSALVEKLGLRSVVAKAGRTKGMRDEDNPLGRVNRLHYHLKRFLREHGGFDRERLQDWLNLFWFIVNGPTNPYDKALRFIELAVVTRKKLRYRDVFPRKSR